uniref:Sorbitol dehydrogenase n=1 Tax=Ascaris suum TaxID=6253 RepID=F1L800_ASCSU
MSFTMPTFASDCRDNVTMEEGFLLKPLSVAVHACRRANVCIGDKVLVLGAGPIGLVNLLTAKAMGASAVFMTDIVDSRLNLGKTLGADHVLNVKDMKAEDVARKVVSDLGVQPDAAIECTGAATSIETGIYAVKSGGTMVMIGLGASRIEMPIVEAATREIDLRGIFRYVNCYPTAIEMISSGKVNLKGLTRAHFKLQESLEAFKRFLKGDVVKVFIHCDDTA